MLDDYPRDARYVTGPPCKYVFIHTKEVDDRVFLFLQEGHTTLPSTSWGDQYLLGGLNGFKRPCSFLESGVSLVMP